MLSWAFNLNWYREAHDRGFDEVILLNEREEVAECTSANIFAVFGDQVYTPPLESGCLPGITREILLSNIYVPGIQISERKLSQKDLGAADSVFITSSTRDVLPVAEIEGLRIQNRGEVCARLQETFRNFIEESVFSKANA